MISYTNSQLWYFVGYTYSNYYWIFAHECNVYSEFWNEKILGNSWIWVHSDQKYAPGTPYSIYHRQYIVEFWDTCMQLFEYNGALVHSNIYCWVLNESGSYSYDRDYWLLEINGWMIYLHGRVAMRNNH